MALYEREYQDLTSGSQKADILPENTLRQLSKSLTTIIPKIRGDIDEPGLSYGVLAPFDRGKQLQVLHRNLLRTADCNDLLPVHGAAALNALCGFFEQCSASAIPEIRDLSSSEAWMKAFDIFLERSERHKAKVVRRLLLTLTDLLSKQETGSVKQILTQHAVSRATSAIFEQQGLASIKPGIQALEHLVHKHIITAWNILESARPHAEAVSTTKKAESVDQGTDMPAIPLYKWLESVEPFTLSVLGWAQYPDCAPAVGRFLPTFFKSLNTDKFDVSSFGSMHSKSALWISPVKQALNRHPETLEVFEHYIVPGLIQLSCADACAFLRTLPVQDINRGLVGSNTVADIHLCILTTKLFASAKTARENDLQSTINEENGEGPDTVSADGSADEERGIARNRNDLCELENLGITLLTHASSSVRIAALSLLISSPASSRPLSPRTIYHLQGCLPHFHIEANPKARNEFIELAKKLCMRVRSATISLLRAGQISTNSSVEDIFPSQPFPVNYDEEEREGARGNLKWHLAFRRWYISFLLHELRPTASYQSHITALKILHPLLEAEVPGQAVLSQSNVGYLKAPNKYLARGFSLGPVLDLLLDPFDDVRQWAALIYKTNLKLNLIPLPLTTQEVEDEAYKVRQEKKCHIATSVIYRALDRAEFKAEINGRADHADGVGRLYDLLFESSRVQVKPVAWHNRAFLIVDHLVSRLEKEVSTANKDLLRAVGNASLHGHLIALRCIASRADYFSTLNASTKAGSETWREYTERIHSICRHVWEAVRDTLCLDAPEGHDPEEEEAFDADFGTTDALSFCWRALKESSSLLHAIVTNRGYCPSSPHGKALQYEDYYRIGNLTFTQLAELRHRGAFSTVSRTFAACCIACAETSDPVISNLVQQWYSDALACMQRKASALTRRSAGMPAMISGTLAACPDITFLNNVVLDLQALADAPVEDYGPEEIRLPQVHALNCLKDIFTDARLGPSTEAHIGDTLEIAASSLDTDIWAIRNCGLMLFKALLRRLNGGTDLASTKVSSSHRHSSGLIYQRYPNITSLILKLLCNGHSPAIGSAIVNGSEVGQVVQTHKVFPALEIIERSGVTSQHRKEISAAIWHLLESGDWSIREKAAKALSYTFNSRDLAGEAEKLLSPDWPCQNTLHGRLLCMRFALARTDFALSTSERLGQLINASWQSMVVKNTCPVTTAAYLNVLADICIILIQVKSPVAQSVFNEKFFDLIQVAQAEKLGLNPALALLSNAVTRCLSLRTSMKCLQDSLPRLSQCDLEAIMILDEAREKMSDENWLAVLRLVPPRTLRYELDVTGLPDIPLAGKSNDAQQADYALAIRGYDLGLACGTDKKRQMRLSLKSWLCTLVMAGSEHSELRTRTAAAHSLRGFFDAMRDTNVRPSPEPQLLGIYLALCDTLVDDDEDVRDLGARTVSSLLSTMAFDLSATTSLSLSPPAAKQRLLRFLEDGYRTSTELFVETIRRLTGLPSIHSTTPQVKADIHRVRVDETISLLRPVAELSVDARTTQIAVFVEEKQNLYIDTVKEADEWTNLVTQLSPSAWDARLSLALESWTIEGLTHFLDTYANARDNEVLGPTSKAEFYTLFMRVILSAKVLMTRSSPASFERKARQSVYRDLLEKLQELGRERFLHELLVNRIESVLEDECTTSH